ncbi:protein madd-4 [Trichonephila clavipes]|nr:protein madd-4 [Trichonephila clavipes]
MQSKILKTCLGPESLTYPVHYFVGPWSRCNGQGFRRRIVHCQTYLEIGQTVARLPDSECVELRPAEVEPCAVSCPPPYPPREKQPEKEEIVEQVDVSFYSWNTEKFSPCSASCSGGIHTSIVRCLRLPDEAEVSPQLCDQELKPESLTKKCNDQPCPVLYKWNITDFGNCSKECGGGIKARMVKCIVVGKDSEVSHTMCPGQPPKSVEPCNVFDCEPAWKTEAWSKCSRSCAGGFQTRKLHCEKILAPLSQAIQLPPSKCIKTRPKAIKKCNLKPCPPPPRTTTTTTTTTTTSKPTVDDDTGISTSEPGEPVFVQKHPNRRVTLKASGQAILFKGSNAKFHCPVNSTSNSSKVLWFKGHLRIPPSTTNGWPRVSVSGKGALRIHKLIFADSGTYTCLAGAFRSDVNVQVKPLPTRQPDAALYSDTSKNYLATYLVLLLLQ